MSSAPQEPSRRVDGPFILKPLLDEVPLSADGSESDVKINCVDYYDNNLYVGTSASELLHFVKIPPDPSDRTGRPVYILASRLAPYYAEPSGASSGSLPGVQQILILPRAGKACIRCNWTVTFYSLPELSPAYGNRKLRNCSWIGGVDLNEPFDSQAHDGRPAAQTVLVSLNRLIQAIRLGEEPRIVHDIPLPGSTLSVRRDAIACVADSKSYLLLDVERQLRIPLMSISSLDESPPPDEIGHAQSLPAPSPTGGVTRSNSSAHNRPSMGAQSHSRSTSLGTSVFQPDSGPSTPSRSPPPGEDGATPSSTNKPLPQPPSRTGTPSQPQRQVFLKPHIASPTPEEFLVIRGTSPVEPCIGMFVNLDGDPTRAPVSFERFPKEMVVDCASSDPSQPTPQDDNDGFVLASMAKETEQGIRHGIDIQPLNASDGPENDRYWLEAEDVDGSVVYGIRSLTGSDSTEMEEIVSRLRQKKFTPFSISADTSTVSLKSADSRTALSIERLSKEKELFDSDSQDGEALPEGWEASRDTEAEEFTRRLAQTQTRLAVWVGNRIWWAMRNPLVARYDSVLEAACPAGYVGSQKIDRRAVVSVLGAIRRREPQTELEFLTFSYLKQKVGLLLLTSLLSSPAGQEFSDGEIGVLEEVLVESSLDPRVVLSLIPGVRNEIIQGRRGIWISSGIKRTADAFIRSSEFEESSRHGVGSLSPRILHLLRRFLIKWRGMKGLPSVSEEVEVYRTVDAALLLVLLELDRSTLQTAGGRAAGAGGAVRKELNEVVDKGVDCFERAVGLLETYHRLFILSRLYQSRKMAGDVLATWRRIVEGERDDGQELRDGELRVREYLSRIRSQPLVQEYGVWLARRNPKLGVQVFTEDNGRAPRFEPEHVVDILREDAPDAVKYYLEHLVFGKGSTGYVRDLIWYYLDVVVGDLESSADRRSAVMATYDAYRALDSPKPAYRHFLADNAPTPAEDAGDVHHSRLRLLQLLSGPHPYDAAAIRARIAAALPADLLVPEAIILSGRERNHEDALRLLVHRLGDYDTAVSYCLGGGKGIMGSGRVPGSEPASSPPPADQQQRLLYAVLNEFLRIEDVSDRVEQTGALLDRFGRWFEVDHVLGLIPDSWSVDVVSGFLVGALRRLVVEQNEAVVRRALNGAQNLRVSHDVISKIDELGSSVEAG
ncbi:vacuolar protein sorting-associated protein 3 [Geosmithia morbida]|uniref:Vacuolar protein sorting-associated protein 3 n=1 Tax=Geosmithia morbida TaxID=1094350 RepID=A0A9P5CZP0_9HYPO|nr:vacuolar protein sorting-associated protein 3 [Geosmithia morbida]KAF4121803.1 vacuolar protein sorting-associated protein 3 [Geosmithia morbida]